VACRVLKVSTSGYYDWFSRPPSSRDVEDAYLLDTIIEVHAAARATYGVRRVHTELVLGRAHRVGRRKVARLMACHGLAGVHRRRWRHHQRAEAVWPDHVQRRFVDDGPDRLWVTDITQHRTSEGWVYCAAVLDVFSRRVVGWSIADHLRTELVVDALEMARMRRKPVLHRLVEPGQKRWTENRGAGHCQLRVGEQANLGRGICISQLSYVVCVGSRTNGGIDPDLTGH
jgi:putative transposase